MAKLVEILARELKEWPEGAKILVQDDDLEAKFGDSACLGSSQVVWERVRPHSSIYLSELADDWSTVKVTRAQWEAERARIEVAKVAIEQSAKELSKCGMGVWIDYVRSANPQATAGAREIARTGTMTNEEQELSDIACGKRSKEDQVLWDKVAIAAMQGLISCDAFHGGCASRTRKTPLFLARTVPTHSWQSAQSE